MHLRMLPAKMVAILSGGDELTLASEVMHVLMN